MSSEKPDLIVTVHGDDEIMVRTLSFYATWVS